MKEISVNDFCRQVDCTYDGEKYSVRDNGAVLRHPGGKRLRLIDGKWTFGKPNEKFGYMEIASVRVHRIVATAFHGDPPTKEHVVDHIDTNRRNNRPDNLRWFTRLENALRNPVTAKRIEIICGSIEAFLENPALLRQASLDRNIEWMRTVSPEEGKVCKENMHNWAMSKKTPSGGSLGEWVFKPVKTTVDIPDLVMSKTPGAAQRNWRVPFVFPSCPKEQVSDPIVAYAKNLQLGSVFAENNFSESIVVECAISDDRQTIWVLCEQQKEGSVKPWSLAQVTFVKDLYVHTNLGTFFDKVGAEKGICIAQGFDWTGKDSIDDYC